MNRIKTYSLNDEHQSKMRQLKLCTLATKVMKY